MQNEEGFSGAIFFSMSELSPVLRFGNGQTPVNNKILIFSENAETIYLLKTLLDIWGYQTDQCGTLEKSLSIAETQNPALILLDSIMPFEASLNIIRQLRKNKVSKAIPIAVLSGFAQPECRSLSLAVGANNFFLKPLDFDALEIYLEDSVKKQIEKIH